MPISDFDQVIQGATDGTDIGNVGDRLKVDASLTSGGITLVPSSIIVHSDDYVKNAGSSAMNVNGSVTAQNFDYSPASSTTVYVDAIGLVISDPGTPDFVDFGSITALTNGLQLKVRTNGTEYTFCNLQNNTDISLHFGGSYAYVPGLGQLGWLNETDFFLGFMTFRNALTLKNSTSDYIRFTVRDNLTAVDRLQALVKAWRVI